MTRILPIISGIMPKTLRGWVVYTLTIIATGIGFASYTLMQSDQFQALLLRKIDRDSLESKFNFDKFLPVSEKLMQNTDVTTVVIWITVLSGHTAHKQVLFSLDGSVRGTITNNWVGRASPIYSTYEQRIDMTHVLEGSISCGKFDPVSEVDRRIYEEGKARYYCSSAIPPTSGNMIGMITVYFDKKPMVDSALKLELRKAAESVVYD